MGDFFAKRTKKATNEADGEDQLVADKKGKSVPWVEKYRPRKVDDLCFQDEIVAVMKNVVQGGDLPHMLFYGPPGTGKTSAAVALTRELFGKAYRDRVLELNASDERGIQVVRNRIKDFARRALPPLKKSTEDGAAEVTVNVKIVILDEADAMTQPAQAAMRRILEKHSKTTRFFLICNYVSRIITPLISRCAKFRFKPLPVESQIERLRFICTHENVSFEEDALVRLIELCEGDLRKSITYLQAVSRGCKNFTKDIVQGMTGRIPDDQVQKLLRACQSPEFDGMMDAVETMRRRAYAGTQLISQLMDEILKCDVLPDINKAEILERMAIAEGRLSDRSDGYLNLLDVASTIQRQYGIVSMY